MRYYRYDLDQITAILDLGAHSLHSLHRPAPFLSLSLSFSLPFPLPIRLFRPFCLLFQAG